MSRMFRIINDRGVATAERPHPAAPEAVALADEPVPFVEIGGPDGLVTSIQAKPRDYAPPEPVAPPKLLEAPVDPADLTPQPNRFLSVTFHRLPKAGLRLVPNGVAPELVVHHFPDHPVSREYAVVRDELRRQHDEIGPKMLGFAAGLPESGTTTVALNLAASLAGEVAAKVLFVDANFARPVAAERLGVALTPGLAEVLAQTTPLAWAVQPTAIANLHAVAAGGAGQGASAGADDIGRLLGQLRRWFDWVIVDAGHWTDAAGQAAISPCCDAVYLVSRQTDLDRPEFTGLRAAVTAAGGVPKGYITTRE